MPRKLPPWNVGDRVIGHWNAQNKARADWAPSDVFIYQGFPKRSRTRALFSQELPECPTCGTKNAVVESRMRVEYFVRADDPLIDEVHDAFVTMQKYATESFAVRNKINNDYARNLGRSWTKEDFDRIANAHQSTIEYLSYEAAANVFNEVQQRLRAKNSP
jgi:hypothetical protein